ncbi:C6 transcription factor, putative [Talaromyces stipitatus ATCC 10500]|uniref:C6 transcription factor, putative n=1 Tax=Talaromyces stipitatus (strain ATCC 10500 / CBS 375.48 / QM 6759 / NRRL 1006) TaxID=441959 RepID=B8M1F5_TALSN|nr:C6 transcription factor, putative [Talaromyces stipitatus ATCC 10500]EED21851.1 C6 transcription factor, putative [Talaromyces stipitatus ATCC 10500]
MNSSRASSTGTEYNPRKRGRTACTRCKNRKQKCGNEYPDCANCRKAGVECDKSLVSHESDNTSGYTRALEERVAFLEGRLTELLERRADTSISSDNPTRIVHPLSAASQRQTPDNVQTGVNSSMLGEIVGFLSLNSSESPAYIGSSSGLSLAVNLGEMVRATVMTKAFPDSSDSSNQRSSRDATNTTSTSHPYKAINLDELLKHRANPPNDEMGSRILNTYIDRVHSRYPFLDRDELWKLHNDRWRLARTKPEDLAQSERFGIFRLYMVYAIASTLISLIEKYDYIAPEKFYMTAIQHVAAACETRSIQNIEAMLLLVIYHLRSATSHGLWYMIGLAMRTCIDLGLHRKSSTPQLDAYAIQLRRRLFWTVYYLERAIAVSLGRPVSINDRHIDVDLPLDVDDDVRDTAALVSEQAQQDADKTTSLSLFRALLRIRQIDSKIQHTIYRADRPLQELRPKIDKLYRLLEAWKDSALSRFQSELDFAMLHYNRSVRLLIQPFLPLLPITDPYYHICLRASGDICQAHKKLHQTLEYGHSFLAVQTVFVSGITMLYALWANTDKVWSVRMSNDIRACSAVLFAMTERAAWVKRYRDTFELLVNATMEKLQGNEAAKTSGMAGMMAAQGYANTMNSTNPNIYQTGDKRQYFGTAPTDMINTVVPPNISQNAPGFPDFPNFPSQEQQPQVQFNFDISEEAMRMAMELAPWIDQELGGEGATTTPLWMPDFDTLQNLTGPYQY